MLRQIYKLILGLLPHNLLVYCGEDTLVCYDKSKWIMKNSGDAILLMKRHVNGIQIVE